MLRVISELRPAWVVGENVAGIVNMALDQVYADLENEGYTVQAFVIPACAVDAPHRRDRCAIVAHAESAECERKRRKAWKRRPEPGCCCDDVSDTDNGCRTLRGNWELSAIEETTTVGADFGGRAPEYVTGEWWTAQPGLGGMVDGFSYWLDEPTIPRIATGIPDRVNRLKCLGNAVVPQQFYPVFQAIADIERGIVHG